MILSRARALCATSRKRIGVAALSGAEPVARLARRHGTSRKFVRAQRERAGHALELAFAESRAPLLVESFPRVSDAWIQRFAAYLESLDEIAEPHEFLALVRLSRGDETPVHEVVFVEHDHAHAHGGAHAKVHQDNNMCAALVHVMADAAVSVLVIGGLILARYFGWLWIDPLVGIVGALVIANWAYGLLRDTGGVLLDMNADSDMAEKVRRTLEIDRDRLADIHLWRIGPGHLSAIVSVVTSQ